MPSPYLDTVKGQLHKLSAWALQKEHRDKLSQARAELHRVFTEHPHATGETYFEHLRFTTTMSARFIYTSGVIIIHGMFPFLLVRTGSIQIENIYRIMKTRIPTRRRQEIDKEVISPLNRPVLIHQDAKVAIIGGGFSGTLALANLIEQASGKLTVEWFESNEALGTGVAYGTPDSIHLLNVRASGMSAFAGQPGHFYQWLKSEEGRSGIAGICPGIEISEDCFAPRALYAEYLRHIVRESMRRAKEKGFEIQIHHATVTDATLYGPNDKMLLTSMRGATVSETLVDAVILATGNLRPRRFDFQRGLVNGREAYITDVWNAPEDHLYPNRVQELPADSEVVIIGTGLTMVDTVLTLRLRGYKGTITAISRHGLLPAAHQSCKAYPAWDLVLAPQFAPRTALGLFTRIRQETARAAEKGYDWRSVIDSLRPATQQLWKQLPTREKRRFFSKLSTMWGIHRHRMAPEIAAELKTLQQNGTLKTVAGKIYYVGTDKDGLTVAYRKRNTNRMETTRPVLVLNCTGPEGDIASSDHMLLRNLRDREMITVGPLRAGIEITDEGTARGLAPHAIFPIGNLLVGELLECTAVPELRMQAQQTAMQLLQRLQILYSEEGEKENQSAGQWI